MKNNKEKNKSKFGKLVLIAAVLGLGFGISFDQKEGTDVNSSFFNMSLSLDLLPEAHALDRTNGLVRWMPYERQKEDRAKRDHQGGGPEKKDLVDEKECVHVEEVEIYDCNNQDRVGDRTTLEYCLSKFVVVCKDSMPAVCLGCDQNVLSLDGEFILGNSDLEIEILEEQESFDDDSGNGNVSEGDSSNDYDEPGVSSGSSDQSGLPGTIEGSESGPESNFDKPIICLSCDQDRQPQLGRR